MLFKMVKGTNFSPISNEKGVKKNHVLSQAIQVKISKKQT
jgi:hypothetical protein